MKTFIIISLLLNFIGAIQAFIVAALLIGRGRKNPLNYFLGSLLIVLGIVIFNTVRILSGFWNHFLWYQDLANGILFLLGPLLYFIVFQRIFEKKWIYKYWQHLLPFLLYLPVSLVLGLSYGKYEIDYPLLIHFKHGLMFWVWNIQTLAYLYVCHQKIIAIHQQQKDSIWILQLIRWFTFIIILNLILTIIDLYVNPIPDWIILNVTLFLSAVILIVLYKSAGDPITFSQVSSQLSWSEEEKSGHLKNLQKSMQTEKVYKESDLKLADLAKKLGITPRQLSQLINANYHQNFNEFINQARVSEVIDRLHRGALDNMTIMGIASESGFKSNSAFYKAFKAKMNQTPKEYLSILRNDG